MSVRHLICIGLATLMAGCASWHRPDMVFRGRDAQKHEVERRVRPSVPDWDPDDVPVPTGPQLISPGNSTLTPPVEGTSQRSFGRPQMSRAVRTRDSSDDPRLLPDSRSGAVGGPGGGYIELPPPPDSR